MKNKVEKVNVNNVEVAIIIRAINTTERIEFFTNPEDQFQIGAFNMAKGEKIQPHFHLNQRRVLNGTVELIYVLSGELIVNFYKNKSKDETYKKVNLTMGDLIFLKSGIHGFEIKENCNFFEVKQGPFIDGKDKIKLYENC